MQKNNKIQSVLFGLHVIAAISTFSAIAFKITLLMIPIILVSVGRLFSNKKFFWIIIINAN